MTTAIKIPGPNTFRVKGFCNTAPSIYQFISDRDFLESVTYSEFFRLIKSIMKFRYFPVFYWPEYFSLYLVLETLGIAPPKII